MTEDKYAHEDFASLTKIYKDAGASDPESWARLQIESGMNQMAKVCFLIEITRWIPKETDLDWVDAWLLECERYMEPGDPGFQMRDSLAHMQDKNVRTESIVDLVRVIRYETLVDVCSVIDGCYRYNNDETPIKHWGLFEIDEDEKPTSKIGSLTEFVRKFDPSAKEFRPRGV